MYRVPKQILLVGMYTFALDSSAHERSARESSELGAEAVASETVANESYELTPEQERSLERQAMSGDPDAAVRLTDRYYFDRTRGREAEFRALSLEWAIIGAENGSQKAQFRAYHLLSVSPDPRLQSRALFWLERAAEGGYEDAQLMLAACPTVDAKHPLGTPCFGPGSEG